MTPPRSIAYLGNSLTVQKAGYRPALHQRLEQHWEAPLQQVNAGLGGVGSLACACLLDLLVQRHQPDLCLIECSAADMLGATSPAQIGPSSKQACGRTWRQQLSLPNWRARLALNLGCTITTEPAACRLGSPAPSRRCPAG